MPRNEILLIFFFLLSTWLLIKLFFSLFYLNRKKRIMNIIKKYPIPMGRKSSYNFVASSWKEKDSHIRKIIWLRHCFMLLIFLHAFMNWFFFLAFFLPFLWHFMYRLLCKDFRPFFFMTVFLLIFFLPPFIHFLHDLEYFFLKKWRKSRLWKGER